MNTYLPGCQYRKKRMSLAYFASGVGAALIILYAVTMWLLKLRRIGADSTRLKLSEESKRRNVALFELLNMLVLSSTSRECINSTVLLTLVPTPAAATSQFEFGLFALACRVAYGWGLAIVFSIVNAGKELYGSEEVFSWWIGMLEIPLNRFEQVHIFGKQVASLFYETTESNGAAAQVVDDSQTAAETFVQSWVTGRSLSPETFPKPPRDVAELYETHKAIAEHPMVASHLGGHAGYKLGAPGGAGEPSIYGPLFGNYVVPAPGSNLSCVAINFWQLELAYGIVMGEDLPARTDGEPHSVESVWVAVQDVILCIECCGRRVTIEAYAGSTDLGRFADTLFSGGVVLGDRLSAESLKPDDLLAATELFVNCELLAQGSGEKCLYGGPVQALTWLANHLNGRGLCLKKGQLVITGQTCMTQAVKVGDGVKATFGEFGTLEMLVH